MTGIRNPRSARAEAARRGGFTLVELIVTVGLFMIIIAIAVGTFTNALRTQRQVSSFIAAQSNVSLAIEQMARQIRTGYLFCHDSGVSSMLPACGCHIDPNPTEAALNVYECSELDFYGSDGHVEYALPATGPYAGMIAESTDGGTTWQPLTSNTVAVQYLQFRLFGQFEGDHWPPRVTISMGIAPSSTDPGVAGDVFNLETTVSSRQIDCITTGGVTSC